MLTPGVSRRILYGPVLSKYQPPIAFKFLKLILLKSSRLGNLALPCDTERDWILSGIVRTQGGKGFKYFAQLRNREGGGQSFGNFCVRTKWMTPCMNIVLTI